MGSFHRLLGRIVGPLALVAVVSAACGTRIERAPTTQASPIPLNATTEANTPGVPPDGQPSSPLAQGSASQPSDSKDRAPLNAAPTAPPKASVSGARTPNAPAEAVRSDTIAASKPAERPLGDAGNAAPAAQPGQPVPHPTAVVAGSPIQTASVGTYSGPIGSSTIYMLRGAQVWVKHINAKGGLNGHQVNLLVYDDGADPSRHKAQVQQAVEKDKVIAFLMNVDAIAGQSSVEYITAKGIPLVGTSQGVSWAYSSPMFFPQHSEGELGYISFLAATANQTIRDNKTKLGTLMCTEAQACTDSDRIFADKAHSVGLTQVYRGRASIAQPDYTAECINARSSSAQVLFVLMDSNSVGRAAASCVRQGFRPTFATAATIVVGRFADDPNLDGLVTMTNVFPWFQANTPATQEYQRAMTTYSNKDNFGVGSATGWTAGKLFEKAAANMPEPPTTAALLKGLWSIKDDDLGGLTLPLTFVQGQSAPQRICWFNLAIENKKWTTPDDFQRHCLS